MTVRGLAAVPRPVRLAGGASHIWLDRQVEASLDESVPQIGAPAAWAKGLTGKGVTVAIADTGVDDTHPDLKGKVSASADFSGSADTVDRVGHGTHVASTVAGDGAAADGRYRGVAPDAQLVSAKVLDDSGAGSWSGVIAGLEWSVEQGADVVNLSLGGPDSPGVDPVEESINRLTEETGTLFVTAAGNQPACTAGNVVGSPATADEALAVGAVDKGDELADFSCVGPRLGDGAIKPEVTAPGVDIVAAKANGTELGEPVGEHYVTASGTSMATPHVAGAAAILLQQHPSWKAAELRARLMSTARAHEALGVFQQGAGRIDVDHATSSEIRTSAGKLELGYFRWPHDDLEPVTRDLTYSNDSDAAVTLDLSIEASGEEPVPADALSLDTQSVTVPAGGSATVAIRLDPSGLAYGIYGGFLTAAVAGTGESLQTPVGWNYESEMYDLTVEGINRDGTPMTEILDVVDIDDGSWAPTDFVVIQNGRTTLRLPPGRYSVGATVATNPTDEAPGEFVVVTQPDVDLRQDTTTVLDARQVEGGDDERQGLAADHPALDEHRLHEVVGGFRWPGWPRRLNLLRACERPSHVRRADLARPARGIRVRLPRSSGGSPDHDQGRRKSGSRHQPALLPDRSAVRRQLAVAAGDLPQRRPGRGCGHADRTTPGHLARRAGARRPAGRGQSRALLRS